MAYLSNTDFDSCQVDMFGQIIHPHYKEFLKQKLLLTFTSIGIYDFNSDDIDRLHAWLTVELGGSGYSNMTCQVTSLVLKLAKTHVKFASLEEICHKINMKYTNRPKLAFI